MARTSVRLRRPGAYSNTTSGSSSGNVAADRLRRCAIGRPVAARTWLSASRACVRMAHRGSSWIARLQRVEDRDMALGEPMEVGAGSGRGQVGAGERLEHGPQSLRLRLPKAATTRSGVGVLDRLGVWVASFGARAHVVEETRIRARAASSIAVTATSAAIASSSPRSSMASMTPPRPASRPGRPRTVPRRSGRASRGPQPLATAPGWSELAGDARFDDTGPRGSSPSRIHCSMRSFTCALRTLRARGRRSSSRRHQSRVT